MSSRLTVVWFVLCVFPLTAAPIDLPSRAAAQNKTEQQPPTVQALILINQFLKAVASGGASQAYYGLTSREFRENVQLQDFKNFLMRFPPLYRNRTVNHLKQEYYDKSVGDEAVPGDAVVVKSILESFDGQQNTAEFVLIFEGGQWRVRSVELFPAPPMGAGG